MDVVYWWLHGVKGLAVGFISAGPIDVWSVIGVGLRVCSLKYTQIYVYCEMI